MTSKSERRSAGQVEGGFIDSPIFNFRDQIEDLARPNLFQVELYFPDIVSEGRPGIGGRTGSSATGRQEESGGNGVSVPGSNAISTMLVKAANLPASTIGVIEVPYRGRTLKIAGDRTFEPWTVTVLNDQEFRLRAKMEEWATRIQNLQQNIQDAKEIGDYQSNAIVRQFSRQGDQKRAYSFQGIWPSTVSAIDLAWDSNDTPEEYTVEFQVQFWSYADDVNGGNMEKKS